MAAEWLEAAGFLAVIALVVVAVLAVDYVRNGW